MEFNTFFDDPLNHIHMGDELSDAANNLNEFLFNSHSPIITDTAELEHHIIEEIPTNIVELSSALASTDLSDDGNNLHAVPSNFAQTLSSGPLHESTSSFCGIQPTYPDSNTLTYQPSDIMVRIWGFKLD